MNPRLTAVLEYARRGWPVLPLHWPTPTGCSCGAPDCGEKAGKHPRTAHGLKDATQDPDVIRGWWERWPLANVGIVTGMRSGLAVLDIDTRHGGQEFLAQLESANCPLPPTPTVRTGGGGGHRFFRRPAQGLRNKVGVGGRPGLDIRADGGYVVAPPSVHASGRLYGWETPPDDAPLGELPAWFLRIALNGADRPTSAPGTTAAPAESIPRGARNSTLTSLAGSMRRRGMGEEAIRAALLVANAKRCAPPLPKAEVVAIANSVSRYELAKPPKLLKIYINPDAPRVIDAAEAALIAAGQEIYTRGRMLVEVSRDRAPKIPGLVRPPGAPAIVQIGQARLRELLAASAEWISTSRKDIEEPALPPSWSVEMLMSRPGWTFPEIALVSETPLLRPDGSVIDAPGYDETTGALYEPGHVTYPPVPARPSLDDARAAVEVLTDPFSDFPFIAASDRSAALAAILTLLARPAFTGPAPMFGVDAPVQGAGKTLLADVIGIIATARIPPKMPAPQDEAEAAKRVLSVALEGLRLVLLDNVTHTLRSAVLSAALTATEWRDRLLGRNVMIDAPLTTVWMVTANNATFASDIARRVVPIRIDPKTEIPEERVGFTYPDLRAHVEGERPRLVAAALTTIRAYHVAGRPPHGKPPMGSFESWDLLIRGALLWVGQVDPIEGRQRIRAESDVELDALRQALAAWHSTFGPAPMTVAVAVERAEKDGELAAALAEMAWCSIKELNGPRLGYSLRRVAGRIVGGLAFERQEGQTHGSARWAVKSVRCGP